MISSLFLQKNHTFTIKNKSKSQFSVYPYVTEDNENDINAQTNKTNCPTHLPEFNDGQVRADFRKFDFFIVLFKINESLLLFFSLIKV